MAIGPQTRTKLKVAELVSLVACIVGVAIYATGSVSDVKAEVHQDRAVMTQKLETVNNRLEKIDRWQDEALERSQKLFDLLYEIKGSVSRIEGQIAK